MIRRDEATERQVTAARPDRSTWLAANAGSGKTRVLTDRVARLLLNGVSPEHILCLTYTKAAASEMQNRLFRRLGEWAMRPNAPLRDTLQELGVEGVISDDELRAARRLFASAIEAPGGLKIQTIHSFCASILRRFPLEAGVSPQFREMEDHAAAMLRAEIVDEMAEGADRPLVAALAAHLSDMDFDAITAEITRHRDAFSDAPDDMEWRALFDLPEDADRDWLLGRVFLGGELAFIKGLLPDLVASGGNDAKAAAKLAAIQRETPEAIAILESVLLTGSGSKEPFTAKIGSFPKKALQNGDWAPIMPQLEDLMRRVEDMRDPRLSLAAMEKTQALHAFARAFLPRYEAAKLMRGWLDFDDLIVKTLTLLTDRRVAEWVLYRLDGGIDHILVDEAQDTSPVQWQVIERLAQEFTSGDGARSDVARTIFVVGDKKQSIYSFQGADPSEFDRMKAEFAKRLSATDTPLQDTTLQYSFRSAEAILRLVDVVFEDRARSGFSKEETHRAFKSEMGGRVDLWPVIAPMKADDSGAWDDPIDLVSEAHHHVQLAERIASEITRMLQEKTVLPGGNDGIGRVVTPGDFLILVRGRASGLFAEINRACKAAGLPIAGADRLRVGAELAVRDLAALMAWLATPEDDLSLAVVLKSPLVGWGERALYDLCHGRDQRYLWRELAARADEFPALWAMLTDLRDHADFLRPYDLIERVLTRHNGRRNLLARLGVEAEDGINALLAQALAYEQTDIPSLTGFLIWMAADDLEIKRQMDSASDRIRVMTVHGAKGLEAPIVILPDTTPPREQVRDALVPLRGQIVWKPRAEDSPKGMEDALEAVKEKDRQERERLLYVAMTRAENWLIVAGAGDMGKDGRAWFETVERGLRQAGAHDMSFAFGDGLRLESGHWPETATDTPAPKTETKGDVPDWAYRPAPPPPLLLQTLSPSDLGGAKALPGEAGQDEDSAKRYGTRVHLALEQLADLPDAARRAPPEDPDAARAFAEAVTVLDTPTLAHVFAPGSLSEVAVSAALPDGQRMHGIIDRLILANDHVLAVDFKTNAVVPATPAEVPEGVLRQMGAYAAMLTVLYPNRRIDTAILWTRTATLMTLPHDLVTEALERTTSP